MGQKQSLICNKNISLVDKGVDKGVNKWVDKDISYNFWILKWEKLVTTNNLSDLFEMLNLTKRFVFMI